MAEERVSAAQLALKTLNALHEHIEKEAQLHGQKRYAS